MKEGATMTVTRVDPYTDNTGDFGWANAHIDEMAEKYPGKIVGILKGQIVVIADDPPDYAQKVKQWFFDNPA
jgi:hypothetical protein